jgi:predicted RNA-binding Zn ribbon-like protein
VKIATYKGDPAVLAADLVNTRGSMTGTDYMPDLDALARFLEEHGIAPGDLSEKDLVAIGRSRDRLKEVFLAADVDAAAAELNEILAAEGAAPRLERVDGELRIGFTPGQSDIARDLTIATAMGLAQLLVDSGTSRFGICSADDCRDVFVDTSRNRSRRYCADSCSSRSNVAAFRARRRSS